MEFKFNLTEQDYLDFNIFVMKNYKFYKKQKKLFQILYTLIPVSLGLYFFIFNKKEFQIKLIMFITMVIISLLFFIFFPKLFEKICQRNVKKILFKEGKINILGQRNIIFDEEKIYIMMEYEENVIMYEKITEIKLSDKAVYLFTAPTIAIILPIRIFSDTKEKKELTNFLENKTNLTL